MDDPRNEPHPLSRTAPVADESGALADYPPALIQVTLDRVVASNTFRRSQRHRRFLEHVVRAGIAGKRDRLKEVIIGIEVFGRSVTDYDPRRDPIVRVEAGRIRDKLARFYDTEGAGEAFQIVLPVGNYMPRFLRRQFSAVPQNAQSLAVLPFSNLSGDPHDASFALGLADQLIDTLGRVPGQKVVGRLSALKARDAGMDLKAIGKLLGVEHVVEGSLQRSGARLRCIAQLSNTRDSVRIWSKRFEHDADRGEDLFDFQDAIAEAVLAAVSALQAPVSSTLRAGRVWNGLLPVGTSDREARELFERGRTAARQRSLDSYTMAIALFERAVELDPDFAQAYSQLGAAYANRNGFNVEPTFPTFANVERAAHRALDLDPLDGEARALLAMIAYRIDFRWHEAEPMFQEALRLAPNSTLVHSSFAWGLVFHRRFEEALRHTRLAQELDPLNIGLRANNGAIAMYAGEYELAIGELQSVIQIEPGHFFSRVVLGVTYLVTADYDEALTHFDHIIRLVPDHFTPKFCRVCALALRGDRAAARRALEELQKQIGDRYYSRINLAMAQTCLGDCEDALASIIEAGESRDMLFVCLPVHPLFQPLRAHPRFQATMARYGLGLGMPSPARGVAGARERSLRI